MLFFLMIKFLTRKHKGQVVIRLIHVMLVDDHTVLRDGLKQLISFEKDMCFVDEAESGEKLLNQLKQMPVLPDVILMDINLPGMDGVEATGYVKKHYKDVRVLILTMHSHDDYLMKALGQGADGYLLKDVPSSELLNAIRLVHKGESILQPSMTKQLFQYHQERSRGKDMGLTKREKDVLNCLVKGMSNMEIAERLFISDKTVKIHVGKIFKKLNAKSRSQAVLNAVKFELVEVPRPKRRRKKGGKAF